MSRISNNNSKNSNSIVILVVVVVVVVIIMVIIATLGIIVIIHTILIILLVIIAILVNQGRKEELFPNSPEGSCSSNNPLLRLSIFGTRRESQGLRVRLVYGWLSKL